MSPAGKRGGPRRARAVRCLLAASAGALLLADAAGALAQIRSINPRLLAPAPSTIRAPAASPAIVSIRPSGCISPGATLYIQARNFSAGEGLAIGGNGAHVDLQIGPDLASVVAVVPPDASLAPGAGYVLGIEKADHSAWLSNLENVTICAATAGASASSPSAPADSSTSAPAAAVPLGGGMSSGGSLLSEPLPPPPAGVPAAAVKEDVTVEPAEVVVVSASMQDAQQIQQQVQALGISIKRRSALGNLGLVVSVFRVPKQLGVANALVQLRHAMPEVRFDANHRYRLQRGPAVGYGPQLVRWPTASQKCTAGMKIGLIDTAIDMQHPALRSKSVIRKVFLPSGVAPAAADHGTAVASLLVGDAGIGLMPGAQLYAAAVFRSRGKDEVDTTAELIARALDWLIGEKVAVINLSFGGERNQLLEAAVMRVERLGVPVFAAAGNGGPDAPPVYPAAQAGVVAVTAVDANLKLYPYANRGDYIAYAAPGVDVWVASPGGKGQYVSGTSYAVPFVTAVFAQTKGARPKAGWNALADALQSHAKDLGAPGRDKVFGWGLIRALGGCGNAARQM